MFDDKASGRIGEVASDVAEETVIHVRWTLVPVASIVRITLPEAS